VSLPEASSLIQTSPQAGEASPQTSRQAPTPAPPPAAADRKYASLHQQAFGALDLQQALQFAATVPKTPVVPNLPRPMDLQAPAQAQQGLWQGYTIPRVSLENNLTHENFLDNNVDGTLNPMDGGLRPQDR
jgi:hypothetical protein